MRQIMTHFVLNNNHSLTLNLDINSMQLTSKVTCSGNDNIFKEYNSSLVKITITHLNIDKKKIT